MANILTHLIKIFDSRFIGSDPLGNRYYERRKYDAWGRKKRFIIYIGKEDDASLLPPEYHAWMHYIIDDFPTAGQTSYRRFYQKPHSANLSGSRMAYKPKRSPATGDYRSWSPNKMRHHQPKK
ncbi:MAG: NADH-ubiquinone oxidoreductase subunit NDUFA12 family protein [Alphaproteobacteria bacterium]